MDLDELSTALMAGLAADRPSVFWRGAAGDGPVADVTAGTSGPLHDLGREEFDADTDGRLADWASAGGFRSPFWQGGER